jgi:hypothetical protein
MAQRDYNVRVFTVFKIPYAHQFAGRRHGIEHTSVELFSYRGHSKIGSKLE